LDRGAGLRIPDHVNQAGLLEVRGFIVPEFLAHLRHSRSHLFFVAIVLIAAHA